MHPPIKLSRPLSAACVTPLPVRNRAILRIHRLLPGMLLWLCAALLPMSAAAADIEVLALFRDQAVINVDGRRYKLKTGESTPDGVRLVSADTDAVVLEIEGKTRRYPLGAKLRSGYQKPVAASEVHVYRDLQGMFTTVGSINGMTVDFLVDTGATAIAMNSGQAKRLGIDYRVLGEPDEVMTASGREAVFRVMLKTVQVGGIRLNNIQAVVLEGEHPQQALLGMSFLGQLKIENTGEQMTLRKKF